MSDYIGLPRVKTASLAAISGGVSAYRERERLREAGLPEYAINEALSTAGGALRGFGRDIIYSTLGDRLGRVAGNVSDAYQNPILYEDMNYAERADLEERLKLPRAVGTGLGSLLAAYQQFGSEEQRARDAIDKYNDQIGKSLKLPE